MKLITGKIGRNHITSAQHRDIIASIAGNESYIGNRYDNLEVQVSANNKININSGILIHHGCVMIVPYGTYDEVTYENGTQGMKRIDLIVAEWTIDSNTGIENCEWKVIQGTPAESSPQIPTYTTGNMQEGDSIDICPVFRLDFDGINVVVTPLLKVLEQVEAMKTKVDELNDNLENLNYGYIIYPDKTLTNAAWTEMSASEARKNPGEANAASGVSAYIQIKKSGKYFVVAQALFAANSSGVRGARIRVNGSDTDESPEFTWTPNCTSAWPLNITRIITLAKGDTIRLGLYQGSGGDLNVTKASVWVHRIGA